MEPLSCLTVLNRKGYGFKEWVEHRTCNSDDLLASFAIAGNKGDATTTSQREAARRLIESGQPHSEPAAEGDPQLCA